MIRVVDSHTEGEPTRVVIAGGPQFKGSTFADRWDEFRASHDDFRRTVILEPRGYEAMVGALLCEPDSDECAAGIFFFNNHGYLDMLQPKSRSRTSAVFYCTLMSQSK